MSYREIQNMYYPQNGHILTNTLVGTYVASTVVYTPQTFGNLLREWDNIP